MCTLSFVHCRHSQRKIFHGGKRHNGRPPVQHGRSPSGQRCSNPCHGLSRTNARRFSSSLLLAFFVLNSLSMGVAKGDEVLHSAHVGIDLSETQGVSGMVGFRTVMAHPLWQEASKKKKKIQHYLRFRNSVPMLIVNRLPEVEVRLKVPPFLYCCAIYPRLLSNPHSSLE